VEYALAMRMEASQDLFVIPDARSHEYVRTSNNGVRAKLGIDATVPFAEKDRYARLRFKSVDIDERAFSSNRPRSLPWLKEG
jgi:2,5-furandicarboxylate decarboxylase 1